MSKILYMMKHSTFFKSITTLATGSFIAQIITVLAAPITTRIFTPEQLGIYTLLITGLGIFGSVICMRYDLTIVTEEKENNVYALVILSTFITIVMSIIVTIGYYFYLKSNGNYKSYVYACIFLLFLLITTGIINILTSYNNRMKEYKLMTQVYVIRTTTQNILMIIFGVMKMGVLGLLSSQLFSQFFSLKKQSASLVGKKEKLKKISYRNIKYVAMKHKNQLLFSTPAALANNISYSSLNIFIVFLFGSATLGFYSLSYRILGLPLTLISGNVSKVFFENASREYEANGHYRKSFLKTVKFLIILAVPMLFVLEFIVPYFFSIIFGNAWKVAGTYIQILAPLFTIRFVVLSVAPGLIIIKKQKIDFFIQLLFVIFSLCIVILCKSMNLRIEAFLFFIMISYSLVYLYYFYFVFKGISNNEKG